MAGLFHYFVEGECEAVLLKAFMHAEEKEYGVYPGKIEILNPLYQKISPAKAMTLKKGTTVVLVYDTDVRKTDVLEDNIEIIVKYSSLTYNDIIFLQSVKTLEDELVYACTDIQDINKLLNTTCKEDFKKKLIKHKDIVTKLKSVGFEMDKMWSRKPNDTFSSFEQGIKRILRKD